MANLNEDPIHKILHRKRSVEQISQKTAEGGMNAEGLMFVESFYEEVRQAAADWKERVGNITKMSVLVPAGIFSLDTMYSFPDLDISSVGIGNHRYFLFHSGAVVWVIKKIYETQLKRTDNDHSFGTRVVNKIMGVMAAGGTFAVGCHLLVDTIQPKSIVFPLFGSLVEGTLVDDNLWLLGNSVYCFKVSHDLFVLALGEDLPKVKRYVSKTFVNPLKVGVFDAVYIRH